MSKLPYRILIRTGEAVERLEAWLDRHCSGDYDVHFLGMDEPRPGEFVKELEIRFQVEGERDAFRANFAKRDVPAWMAGSERPSKEGK